MTIARLPFSLEVRRPPDGSALLILAGESDLHNQAEVAAALHTEIDVGCRRIVACAVKAATSSRSSAATGRSAACSR